MTRWEELPGFTSDPGTSRKINVYSRSDECGAGQVWGEYLGGSQDDLAGVRVYGDPGVADAVIKDAAGIGYNNINFAFDAKTEKTVAGLEILKLDFNRNGKIDPDEDVYATRRDLINAIVDGRFPSPPARNLYFVTKGKPQKKSVFDFLLWVFKDGQRFIDESGYIAVKKEERDKCLKALNAD